MAQKYVVRDADIWTEKGRQPVDTVVELEAKEAKHFNSLGYLAPYIPEDEETEEEIGELDLRSPPLIAEHQHGGKVEEKARGPARR